MEKRKVRGGAEKMEKDWRRRTRGRGGLGEDEDGRRSEMEE